MKVYVTLVCLCYSLIRFLETQTKNEEERFRIGKITHSAIPYFALSVYSFADLYSLILCPEFTERERNHVQDCQRVIH